MALIISYLLNLLNDLSSNCKLFADDTSLFSVVNKIHTSATALHGDQNALTN